MTMKVVPSVSPRSSEGRTPEGLRPTKRVCLDCGKPLRRRSNGVSCRCRACSCRRLGLENHRSKKVHEKSPNRVRLEDERLKLQEAGT